MKIGITAATGQLGRLVVENLRQRVDAADIVALVRSPAKAAALGVEARPFDYEHHPDALATALQGIDALLLISGSEVGRREAQHRNVVQAARQAGVQRIAYTSILRADTTPIDLGVEHRATEAALRDSGIPHTILRHGWYTENYTGSIGGALAGGALVGSAGTGRISSATRADFAEADAIVISENGHEDRTYELAGDDAWTLEDLAAEISRQAGRTIPYRDLPQEEYAKLLVSFGLPEPLARAIAGWDVAASQGALYDDTRLLSSLIGRRTTPLSEAVAQALRAQKAA